MDRNHDDKGRAVYLEVALRKESVDRNDSWHRDCHNFDCVALRKESVDRNSTASASSRAYIMVALRKESVDRNHSGDTEAEYMRGSLSARRAWIEIANQTAGTVTSASRSPQGERG